MALLHRKKIIQAKSQSSEGVTPTFAATDCKLVIDPTITIEPEKLDRNYLSDKLIRFPHLIGRKHVTVAFGMELKGRTAGDPISSSAPIEADPLFRACRFSAVYVQVGASADIAADYVYYQAYHGKFDFANSQIGYVPVCIRFYQEGILHEVIDAVGKCDFIFAAGEIPRVNFTFSGLYKTASGGLTIPDPVYDPTVPMPTFKGTFNYGGATDLVVQQLTIDVGQAINVRQSIAADHGIAGMEITERAVVGNMNPEMAESGNARLWDEWEGGMYKSLTLSHGTENANKLLFECPSVGLDSIAYEERAGILAQGIPLTISTGSSSIFTGGGVTNHDIVFGIGGSGLF